MVPFSGGPLPHSHGHNLPLFAAVPGELLPRASSWIIPVMPTREKHPVTFLCEWCSNYATELHGPGPAPRYCAGCKVEAQRELNRKAARAYRAAHQPSSGERRPVGRPKKS